MRKIFLFLILVIGISQPASASNIDGRVKTLIYDAGEVYKITTHFGYQSNIEFEKGEEIETISVGDGSSWQLVPARRYLFIRAMQDDAHTNMSVITNRRAYQFDLRAAPIDGKKASGLTYVVRFHYPENDVREASQAPESMPRIDAPIQPVTVGSLAAPLPAAPLPIAPLPVAPAAPVEYASAVPTAMLPPLQETQIAAAIPESNPAGMNYNYTLSGPEDVAPLKVFDDGIKTYIQFPQNVKAQIYKSGANGKSVLIAKTKVGEFFVINSVEPTMTVKSGKKTVKIYNESMISSSR